MNTLNTLRTIYDNLQTRANRMPLYFIGHGSPMNGIEENEFSATWRNIGRGLEPPAAVLCISAHWFTQGTFVTAMDQPRTIHDFNGFPRALFDVNYPAPGSPVMAKETASLVKKTSVGLDHEWGLDHGTWSVVRNMFPDATIPVIQLSIDYSRDATFHYELANEFSALRKKGVLIIGSGNMVHNLGVMNWKLPDSGFDWAVETNDKFKALIAQGDHQSLLHYETLGEGARLSIPTPEHYLPMVYTLGLKEKNESVEFFNDKMVMGSVSMTSLKIS